MSIERVEAVDLLHYQHHPHLQSCWRNNLDLEAVKWETVVKVGVAPLRPPTLVMRNTYLSSSLSEPITISRISFINSARARFAHETSQRCIFNKLSAQLTRQTAKSLLKEVELLQATWLYNAVFLNLCETAAW